MNLVYNHCVPLRLLIVNPLSEAGRMLCVKALRGVMFGLYQMINLELLVYANEVVDADRLKWELDSTAFPCNNGITVTSSIPEITDADIFVFISDFPSLNSLDFTKMDENVVFDSLYLILKVANNLEILPPPPPSGDFEVMKEAEKMPNVRRQKKPDPKPRRPLIVTDGLVALNIVKSFSKNLPNDIFFCPTPLSSIAKTVLAEKLGISPSKLNLLLVWAGNDEIFHVDIKPPVYVDEKSQEREHCEWDQMANKEYEALETDFTQFNAAWLKKDYILKLQALMANHPIGSVYKSAKLCRLLQDLWKTRSLDPKSTHPHNVGIISDGSLETHKGLPYFLPVIHEGETYKVNKYLQDDFHLKQEIKRMNKAVLEHHRKLISYCKDFLERNVIKMDFLPNKDSETTSSHGFTIPSTSIESPK